MPLTQEQEELEHEYRVEQMIANIGQMRANEDKLRSDILAENRKFKAQVWGIVLTGAGVVVAAFAAGAAWMHYIH